MPVDAAIAVEIVRHAVAIAVDPGVVLAVVQVEAIEDQITIGVTVVVDAWTPVKRIDDVITVRIGRPHYPAQRFVDRLPHRAGRRRAGPARSEREDENENGCWASKRHRQSLLLRLSCGQGDHLDDIAWSRLNGHSLTKAEIRLDQDLDTLAELNRSDGADWVV